MIIHLYVKIHNDTGLKYFGKTTKDPFKYRGSGKYWLAHLKKHGANITTEVVRSFDDAQEASTFALQFSIEHDIVKSPIWANMIPENALDGAPPGHSGHTFTETELTRIGEKSKQMWQDPVKRQAIIDAQRASWDEDRHAKHQLYLSQHWTAERRQRQREAIRGRKKPGAGGAGRTNSAEHNAKVSAALRAKTKTRCCRILDHREMTVGEFTKWVNRLQPATISG